MILCDREQSSALRTTLRLIPGAGVTPAEGSVKPTAGFTYKSYCMIFLLSDDAKFSHHFARAPLASHNR